jgi:hypothetical protein
MRSEMVTRESTRPETPLLRVQEVGKQYGKGLWGVRGVNISLGPGILGLVGPNGAGALFVPALAVACGVLSGGSTLLEGVYLPLWYLGPLNKITALDFAATSGPGHPLAYLALAAALVATALAVRRGG